MDPQGPGSAANNSSDFVRKLYKMLEDPSYESVVRWGNESDSFVVLENEKFTKSILPKHFKHSNFASFVRQLNKYDFHKVRHNNEESGQSPYGAGAWEFKHPDFKANNKDALDNIRRKAPVPRKPNAPPEELIPTQQMDLVNTQLVATQQQLQSLQERYNELSMHHSMLLQEVIGLQKTVVNHEHVMQNVMSFLHSVDAQRRRDSKMINPFAQQTDTNGVAGGAGGNQEQAEFEDEPASPLQHADKLLNDINAEVILNPKGLEEINHQTVRMNGAISTPPPHEAVKTGPRPNSRGPPPSAVSTGSRGFGDIDNMVYPIGQTNGIDPMYSEHINNIPYPMPTKPAEPTDPRFIQQADVRKKNNLDPGWVRQPQILLVEDDPTCRRIGGKFLYAFNCNIDSALDGLEAVNKMNAGHKYDLVLMDIIMPNLDGVSACHLIRQFDSTPIIAMTSNIRSDDISMYFQHGMNDVLPKPFTKEGLLSMLDKHLAHLKKIDNVSASPSMHNHGAMASHHQSVKDEDSPSPSNHAASSSAPHNPMQALAHGVSPVTSTLSADDYLSTVHRGASNAAYSADGSMHYASAPQTPLSAGSGRNAQSLQQAQQQQQQQHAHRRQISDISGGPGDDGMGGGGGGGGNAAKRQQMYGHGQHLSAGRH